MLTSYRNSRSIFIVLLVSLFSISMIVGCGQNESTNAESEKGAKGNKTGVALKVGSKTLTHAEFQKKLNKQMQRFKQRPQLQQQLQQLPKKQRKKQMNRIKGRLKAQLARKQETQMLLEHHMDKAGISVPDEKVQKRIDQLKKERPQLEKLLKQQGESIESIKKKIRQQLRIQQFIEQKVGTIEISEEEARNYYKKNKEQFNKKERVKARHILIKDTSAAGKKKTQSLKKEIDQGAKFSEVARRESEGPSSKRGGSLDYIKRGDMVKPFSETAFNLEIGEVSDPVKTRYGWHLIKVEDRKAATDRAYEDVADTIVQQVKSRKKKQKFQQILQQLRKETEIVNNIDTPSPRRSRQRRPGGRGQQGRQPAQR